MRSLAEGLKGVRRQSGSIRIDKGGEKRLGLRVFNAQRIQLFHERELLRNHPGERAFKGTLHKPREILVGPEGGLQVLHDHFPELLGQFGGSGAFKLEIVPVREFRMPAREFRDSVSKPGNQVLPNGPGIVDDLLGSGPEHFLERLFSGCIGYMLCIGRYFVLLELRVQLLVGKIPDTPLFILGNVQIVSRYGERIPGICKLHEGVKVFQELLLKLLSLLLVHVRVTEDKVLLLDLADLFILSILNIGDCHRDARPSGERPKLGLGVFKIGRIRILELKIADVDSDFSNVPRRHHGTVDLSFNVFPAAKHRG